MLTRVYTEISRKDILTMRSMLAAITDDVIADSAPLGQILRQEVTPRSSTPSPPSTRKAACC